MERRIIGLPPGFRDLLLEDAETNRRIENVFAGEFSSAGYHEILPSGVEFLDVYARGSRSAKDRCFKFFDREDNLLALRADFTPAVARIVVAHLHELPPPVRLWYSGSVFRRADMQRGQYHEFGQIGAELIGVNNVASDAEVLSLALRGLTGAGVADACVHVNHAGIFRGIVGRLGLDAEAQALVRSEIDRKDVRALGTRLEQLGIEEPAREEVRILSKCVGGTDVLTTALEAIRNPQSHSAILELSRLAAAVPQWSDRIVFDLTEIDEMEYYSGCMFTFYSPSHTGELGKGGRYDGLLEEFGADLPAVGFSLSVDHIRESL
ncbi:MAG: ATP phosphoribosyltransferase regulatory subunit [Bacteroidota bacterium]